KNEIDMSLPVGTSSLRRSVQLKEMMPGVTTAPVRGNVETRLRKLDDGEYSALILAAAGLIRLGLQDRISSSFNTEDMIPATCQGILGIQARASSQNAYLRKINHTGAMLCAMAERAFIRELGAGCGSPDTAYAYIEDGKMHITGMRYDEAKGTTVRKSLTGAPAEAKRLGRGLALLLKEVF
ncbi:MAG: hydroxymethylbilane synthase, partial [Mogibacterium sp.]|nr:hydroxymethylbilane synthase [Mogibacterium sp.]